MLLQAWRRVEPKWGRKVSSAERNNCDVTAAPQALAYFQMASGLKGLPAELFIEICQGFVAGLQAYFEPKSPHQNLLIARDRWRFNARMTPIRANIVGPPDVATRIKASIAACHSAASCSAFGSLVM